MISLYIMKYPIVTVPDPVLREKCKPVDLKKDRKQIEQLIGSMIEAMRNHDGIGLSAPQLGKLLNIIVAEYKPEEIDDFDPPFDLQILINPRIITKSKETNIYVEGCLSLPNLEIEIERPADIIIEYQDLNGKTIRKEATGLLSRVIQHEADHLEGILFTDHLPQKYINQNMEELKKIKFGFISSSNIAIPLLEKIADSSLRPDLIITESAKPAGRGLRITSNPLADFATNLDLPVLETDSKDTTLKILEKYKLDACLVFAFGQILPQQAIDAVKYGIYNVHPSLLPKLRGATPIQSALLDDLNQTGISLIKIDTKVDSGDLIAQVPLAINKNDHCRDLWDKVGKKTAEFIPNAYVRALTGQIIASKQNENEATYTKKIEDTDLNIKPSQDPQKIYRLIKASNCSKRPYVFIKGRRIIFDQAEFNGKEVILKYIQIEGKKVSEPNSLDDNILKDLQNYHKLIKCN